MGDAVAEAVLAQFASLPKTGKPQPHEHTVLAGIAVSLPAPDSCSSGGRALCSAGGEVLPASKHAEQQQGPQQEWEQEQEQQRESREVAVVAIGTGTKCLGASRRLPGGGVLNDCHAEALCRRALLRWLYCEMLEAVQQYRVQPQAAQREACQLGVAGTVAAAAKGTRVLRLVPPRCATQLGSATAADDSVNDQGNDLFGGWRFELQPGVRLHMYVSQPPCGDASILDLPSACRQLHQPSEDMNQQQQQQQHPTNQQQHIPLYNQQQQQQPGNQQQQQQAPQQGIAQQRLTHAQHAGTEAAVASCGACCDKDGGVARPASFNQPSSSAFGRTGAKPLKRQRLGASDGRSQIGDGEAVGGLNEEAGLRQEQETGGNLYRQQQQDPLSLAEQALQQRHDHHNSRHQGADGWQLPQQHEVESYGEAQQTGVVRRKPGRGDATLSMSCSDKLSRWVMLGLQGSLLGGLLAAPLHLSSITVGLPQGSQPTPVPAAVPAPALAPAPTPTAAPASVASAAARASAAAAVTAPGTTPAPAPSLAAAPAVGIKTIPPPAPPAAAAGLATVAAAAPPSAANPATTKPADPAVAAAAGIAVGARGAIPLPALHTDNVVAAAADAALRRALLGRTAQLAAQRLPPGFQQSSPTLHIHTPTTDRKAAMHAHVAGAGVSATCLLADAPWGAASGGWLEALGLALSATRRAAAGASVVWVAPPSCAFKWKQQQLPTQTQEQRQPAVGAGSTGRAAEGAASGGTAGSAAQRGRCVSVLCGGNSEAVTGSTGLKAGTARLKAGQLPPPSAQPSVCKAALYAEWRRLVAALRQLEAPLHALPEGTDEMTPATKAFGAFGAAPATGTVDAAPSAATVDAAPALLNPQSPAGQVVPAVQPAEQQQGHLSGHLTYRQAKRAACPQYAAAWQRLREPPSPLQLWIPKPAELEEFVAP